MSYFSIAAPQTVVLPDGSTLSFRINPANSALVEIHLDGVASADDDTPGKHVLSFNRNGSAASQAFVPKLDPNAPQPYAQPVSEETAARKDAADKGIALIPGEPVAAQVEAHEANPPPTPGPLAGFKSVNDDAVRQPLPDPNVPTQPAPVVTSGSLAKPVKPA
jgi:hypothetical protein